MINGLLFIMVLMQIDSALRNVSVRNNIRLFLKVSVAYSCLTTVTETSVAMITGEKTTYIKNWRSARSANAFCTVGLM